MQSLGDKAISVPLPSRRTRIRPDCGRVAEPKPVDDLRVEDWDEMIDINVKGVPYDIAAALPVFRKQGFGHFVNTASRATQSAIAWMLTLPEAAAGSPFVSAASWSSSSSVNSCLYQASSPREVLAMLRGSITTCWGRGSKVVRLRFEEAVCGA